MCPNGAGISRYGDADLRGELISGFVHDMIRTEIPKECSIEEMPEKIINYFNCQSAVPDTNFLVAGYDSVDGKKVQTIFQLNTRSRVVNDP